MPPTTPTSFRLPAETLTLLRTLARPGESLSSVVGRAVLALEAAPVPLIADGTASRLDALEVRIAALEACSADVAQTPLQACSASVAQTELQPCSAKVAQTELRGSYPPEVRRMAVRMQREGATNREILTAIRDANNGKVPLRSNLATALKRWAKDC